MHGARTQTLTSGSPDQTCVIAQRLAPGLQRGDVILLRGGIGAGKTHFARCLIQALLPAPEEVPSPTYTLIQTYPVAKADIWHADLYRLTDTNEVFELGLVDAFTDAICLVEWPDRLGDLAPPGALNLTLTAPVDADTDAEVRRLTFTWQGVGWDGRIAEALND